MGQPHIAAKDIPPDAIELAEKRTAPLFQEMQYGRLPMRSILASAHLQGMTDMFLALQARGFITAPPDNRDTE